MPSKGEPGDLQAEPVLERPSNPSPQPARAATKHEKLEVWSPVLDTIRDKITKQIGHKRLIANAKTVDTLEQWFNTTKGTIQKQSQRYFEPPATPEDEIRLAKIEHKLQVDFKEISELLQELRQRSKNSAADGTGTASFSPVGSSAAQRSQERILQENQLLQERLQLEKEKRALAERKIESLEEKAELYQFRGELEQQTEAVTKLLGRGAFEQQTRLDAEAQMPTQESDDFPPKKPKKIPERSSGGCHSCACGYRERDENSKSLLTCVVS